MYTNATRVLVNSVIYTVSVIGNMHKKFGGRLDMQFRGYARGQTDRQTDRHGYHNTSPPLPGANNHHLGVTCLCDYEYNTALVKMT